MPWLVDHLKNPSDNCFCHKSKAVDGLRKNTIKFLEHEY